MKNIFAVLICILFMQSSFCQVLSLQAGFAPDYTRVTFSNSEPCYFAGFSFDKPLYKRLGISTGILLNTITIKEPVYSYLMDIKISNQRFSIIEIPINLSLRITNTNNERFACFLLSGYSFGRFIRVTQDFQQYYPVTKPEENQVVTNHYDDQPVDFLKFGLEARRMFFSRVILSAGVNYRLRISSETLVAEEFGYSVCLKTGWKF